MSASHSLDDEYLRLRMAPQDTQWLKDSITSYRRYMIYNLAVLLVTILAIVGARQNDDQGRQSDEGSESEVNSVLVFCDDAGNPIPPGMPSSFSNPDYLFKDGKFDERYRADVLCIFTKNSDEKPQVSSFEDYLETISTILMLIVIIHAFVSLFALPRCLWRYRQLRGYEKENEAFLRNQNLS
ncbi:MAG: hypothetical protein HQ483_18045 [Rhodospirillales bacterium]|nr:hypothetical protein [Rhodospirillales bacterium]